MVNLTTAFREIKNIKQISKIGNPFTIDDSR
jgi:hypothetical protein